MSSEPERNRLPFEPAKKRKKPAKNSPETATASTNQTTKETKSPGTSTKKSSVVTQQNRAIPPEVSKRMGRRMAFFCGLPSSLGMITFVVSYIIVSQKWFDLPNAAVVLVSMGFFGLGVLGLSYGVLSASWDEAVPGSLLGVSEFSTNVGRMVKAWRSRKNMKTED